MNAFPAAKRALIPLVFGALVVAAPALAADGGYLGVMLQDLSPAMAKALQLGDQSGVLISDVVDDSPAEKAGLQDGDVIIAFAGKPLSDYESLTAAVRAAAPGDKVDVTVMRDGKKKTVQVELGERKDAGVFAWANKGDDDHAMKWIKKLHGNDDDFDVHVMDAEGGWLGIGIDDLTPQLGEYFGVEDGDGVLVTSVVDDSPAAKAGLKAGDVIVKLGDEEIEDTGDLHEALSDTKADQKVKLEFRRKGKDKSAEVTLGEMPEGSLPSALFFGDDDATVHMKAPRMMLKRMPHMDRDDVRMMTDPHRRIEVIREMDDARDDIKQMRKELDQMRAELDQMRKELQKK